MLTIELLEKYHTGELKPEEMQQIEKAMLQNPFLAEMVEGIAVSETLSKTPFSQQVLELKKEMPYHKNDKIIDFTDRELTGKRKEKSQIYRLVAVILFLLTTGTLLWFYAQNIADKTASESSTMAYQTSKNEKQTNGESLSSIPQATTADLKQELILDENKGKTTQNDDKGNLDKNKARKTLVNEQNESVNETKNKSLRAINIPEGATESEKKETTLPILSDKDSKDLKVGEGQVEKNDLAKVSLQNGKDVIKADPKPQLEDGKSNEALIISDDSDSDSQKEFAKPTPKMDNAKKESEIYTRKQKTPAAMNVYTNKQLDYKKDTLNLVATPEIGWENYQIYLNKNLQKSVSNGKKGKVIAEITINGRGKVDSIIILQSLCEPCDAEVKRLILAGGKWKIINKREKRIIKELVEVVF
jgi:hypothetical protein